MRVWFLKEHESVCPGCSTGCNVSVDERDGEVQRLRPRRNVDVNKSWMCDPGRALYKQIGVTDRVSGARVRGPASWEGVSVAAALDRVASAVKEAGAASAFLASPQGTNEDVFAFKALAEAVGRQARLPGRRPAPQGARADRPRAPARRPQPEHAGLPRPGRRPGRRRRDPRGLPRRGGEGPRPPGPGDPARARGRGRDREGAVRGRDGDARGPRARPGHGRAARGPVGRGRGHVHQLPAARAAAEGRGARSRRRAAAVAARRRPAAAAREAARGGHGRARSSRSSRRRRPTTRPSTTGRSARSGKALPSAEAAAPAQEARA